MGKMKDLPLINVVLKKIKEGDQYFNFKSYVGDEGKYFENLQQWKTILKTVIWRNIIG